jgi:hypothetical protein
MYVDPTFKMDNIESIAIFPIRNARVALNESNQINRKIAMSINNSQSNIRVLGPVETINILNENDLAEYWADFLDNYIMSGIPDQKRVKAIGDALEVDAFIQGEILDIQQKDGVFGYYAGKTRVTVRYTMIDTGDAKVLWEATSDGISSTATTLESAPPIISAIEVAVDKIISNLPFNPIQTENKSKKKVNDDFFDDF